MPHRDWNENYATNETPWDTGVPDPHLVELVDGGVIAPGRVLEVGCGTGTNALWLASKGFDVLAIDVAERAIAAAEAKRGAAGSSARFAVLDFLAAAVPDAPFDFVFDRGVLHVFDDAPERAEFARRVAAVLKVRGQWLSLAGSTEGPPREHGPPRRTAGELIDAIEPALEIVELRATAFADTPFTARAWLLRAGKRDIPAQPSTRHD
jgi:SAM-dependent methyltransferase